MPEIPRDSLTFPESERSVLEPYMPPRNAPLQDALPFTTLTFATSLDSSIALSPGVRTALSGPQSKAMTHYLRSRHDAILIGVGTAIADNPSLNSRLHGVVDDRQPRPVIIDPTARLEITEQTRILELVRQGCGRAPFIITGRLDQIQSQSKLERQMRILEEHSGKYISLATTGTQLDWTAILQRLRTEGIKSIMIEGGGAVINDILGSSHMFIDSVIVTIAPTWFGQGGVVVSPKRRFGADGNPIPASRLRDVKWYPLGEDVVLCGRIKI